eukprot:scaffold179778_cov30-Prasinocladus_malaysianus.AAC.1
MQELKVLLNTVDFDVETERTVRQKLAARLGCKVDKWKQLIKRSEVRLAVRLRRHEGINAFLCEGSDAEEEQESEDGGSGPDESDLLEEMDKPKNKRKAASTGATKQRAKKEKITRPAELPTESWRLAAHQEGHQPDARPMAASQRGDGGSPAKDSEWPAKLCLAAICGAENAAETVQ